MKFPILCPVQVSRWHKPFQFSSTSTLRSHFSPAPFITFNYNKLLTSLHSNATLTAITSISIQCHNCLTKFLLVSKTLVTVLQHITRLITTGPVAQCPTAH